MSKILTLVTAVALVGFAAEASAGNGRKQNSQTQAQGSSQSRLGSTGGNAALQGNNGNSGQGSNSLGHIKGGNIGGGK